MTNPLSDHQLWGNEAAEDEDTNILESYFVPQRSVSRFFDRQQRLVVATARKGMGKSALIKKLSIDLARSPENIVVNITGTDLAALRPMKSLQPAELVNDWKQRLCWCINREIGARIDIAIDDDAMNIVDTAELSGYKRKNLVGSLVSRLSAKLNIAGLSLSADAKQSDNQAALFSRFANDNKLVVWLLVDDIDATFVKSKESCWQVSTFLSACRDLANDYSGTRIRTCVRADVWTTILSEDEAMDKVDQYLLPLKWSKAEIGQLLSNRIVAYRQRNGLPLRQIEKSNLEYLQHVFPRYFAWKGKRADPHRVLAIMANDRPRWTLKLCRMASTLAAKQEQQTVKIGHIYNSLEDFGLIRIADLKREHEHQCPEIVDIAYYFYKSDVFESTSSLVAFVSEKLQGKSVLIDGVPADARKVARFLFRIGFLVPSIRTEKTIKYFQFETKPALLANIEDDEIAWSISPGLKTVLSAK